MPEFNPSPNDRLVIGGQLFQVKPHPSVPAFAFGQEGRKAFVFQVSGGADNGLYALKKFKHAYRVPELVEVNDSLARFASWPGLEVCARTCLQYGPYDDVLNDFPDLEYAVLMPWISGRTWYDIVISMIPLTRREALTFANGTAQVLSALEESGLAHCDIAAANIIVNPTTGRAHLIDVEDIYAPGFSPPAALPAGTDGYAHKVAYKGLWEPAADRFAGAVLICEMAAWHIPEIRKEAEDEHFFAPKEMQEDSPRYQLMRDVLGDMDARLPDLFDQAWFSDTLEDCPPLRAWQTVISDVHHHERLSEVVSEFRPIMPGGTTASAPAASARAAASAPVEEEEPTIPEPVVDLDATRLENPAVIPAPNEAPAPTPTPTPPPTYTPPVPQPPPVLQSMGGPIPAAGADDDGPVKEWRPLQVPEQANNGATGFTPFAASQPLHIEAQPEAIEPVEDEPPTIDLDDTAAEFPQIPDATVLEQTYDIPEEVEEEAQAPPDLSHLEQTVISDSTAVMGDSPLKPLLSRSHMEDNRPMLVWTETSGTDYYELEESDTPDFPNPKVHEIEGDNTFWRAGGRPFWKRGGQMHYRVRAWQDDFPGLWSNTLTIDFGTESG